MMRILRRSIAIVLLLSFPLWLACDKAQVQAETVATPQPTEEPTQVPAPTPQPTAEPVTLTMSPILEITPAPTAVPTDTPAPTDLRNHVPTSGHKS